ncbi:CRIB domain-containing protein RIC4-like [Iris pallida]|uniref:CRIB domain-containing protein RIC4-like n=1 Tax=Iris pallida TaxID=29817 RepID=A0AAX6GTC5_IRIPA|nr:CRIB domain-containing protein RIC4-like [Iris pallida]
MRERIDRFSILPFSIGCVSQSSVDVVAQPKKSHSEPNPLTTSETIHFNFFGLCRANIVVLRDTKL